jgi:CRISPR-associated protein Csm2
MNTFNRSSPNQGRPAPSSGSRPEMPEIPVADIRFGERISDELYAGIAEKSANFLADNSGDRNKYTQLRRFYDELGLWHERINGSGTPEERAARYQEFAPLIKMLNAKVVYAEGRKHVDGNFVRLFRQVIKEVKDAATLGQAKLFMEAFMGFYKATKKG